jgi:prenyltransferase beta subunit
MSLRLEMLQVARLAPKMLGDSVGLVRNFLLLQQNEDGGFKDRSGKSDLYYTVFGLDSLLALQAEPACGRAASYLDSFRGGEGLDFVHLCCLARCWAAVTQANPSPPASPPAGQRKEILGRIESYRCPDGGYHPTSGSDCGTAYGCFLALGAYQDLKVEFPDPLRLVQCLKFLETPDGAWANERAIKVGSTNATAAAITLLRNLNIPVNPEAGTWLLARRHAEGGFLATPNAPLPDLLSTATALHALAGLEASFEHVKEQCLDFIDTLWTNEGGFHGHWNDDCLDCEYTFYGLLALGHLSL